MFESPQINSAERAPQQGIVAVIERVLIVLLQNSKNLVVVNPCNVIRSLHDRILLDN